MQASARSPRTQTPLHALAHIAEPKSRARDPFYERRLFFSAVGECRGVVRIRR